jgi:hypothetical protein
MTNIEKIIEIQGKLKDVQNSFQSRIALQVEMVALSKIIGTFMVGA